MEVRFHELLADPWSAVEGALSPLPLDRLTATVNWDGSPNDTAPRLDSSRHSARNP